MTDNIKKRDSVSESAKRRDGVSPTPWRVVVNPLNGELLIKESGPGISLTVGNTFKRADAEFLVEAVNRFAAHRENAPLPSARGAELSSASRPTGAKLLPAVTAGETASMLLPWTVEGPFPGQRETKKRHGFAAYANIVNRLGIYVAQGLPPEVAAGIVEAVNYRDRLRDIVRRLVSSLSTHHSAMMMAAMSNREEFDTPDVRKLIDADAALLREAREALGEEVPE